MPDEEANRRLGKVNTRMAFDVRNSNEYIEGWGMSPLNAPLVRNISIVADQLLQAELVMFLSDPIFPLILHPVLSGQCRVPMVRILETERVTNAHSSFQEG